MLFTSPELDDQELQALADIADLERRLCDQLHEQRPWHGSLRRLAIARVIQGSTGIEGYDALLEDAAAVAVGEEPLTSDQETRLALKGYRDAMTYVFQLASDDAFRYSTQVLKVLHAMMSSYDLRNGPGQWRAGAIYVRQEETGEILYQGPEVDQVPVLMEELAATLNGPCGERVIDAAMAHLNLAKIHPFRDGNGRMARCLQSLVLARGQDLAPVFLSIEEYLSREKVKYDEVLAQVGRGSWGTERDSRPWVRFILTTHLRQARTMLRRVRETERLWASIENLMRRRYLPGRVTPLMFDAASGLRVRNATYRAILKDAGEEPITEQTASRDLQRLVAAGVLKPAGERRGRSYAGGADLARLRQELIASRDPRDDSDPFQA
ncbi:MAG: Fic family protein [Streptosporangiaceae bacterium]